VADRDGLPVLVCVGVLLLSRAAEKA